MTMMGALGAPTRMGATTRGRVDDDATDRATTRDAVATTTLKTTETVVRARWRD